MNLSTNTGFLPADRMLERAGQARADSDSSYFLDLLYLGEMAIKVLVVELLAAMQDDRDQNRYALEFRLIRADSIGTWAEVLGELLQGPASQHLLPEGQVSQRALVSTFADGTDSWQRRAVSQLDVVCAHFDVDHGQVPKLGKISMRQWVAAFVWLRNRTRGHGSPRPSDLADVCPALEASIETLLSHAPAFQRSWAYIRQNLSGKYRVSSFGGEAARFNELKSSTRVFSEGVYVHLGSIRRAGLMFTDPDLRDFMLPNGGFKGSSFEALSYITDDRRAEDATHWQLPVDARPSSETSAPALEVIGNSFANIPTRRQGYVARKLLEEELMTVVGDDRHPVITLQGRGGVGKTSLALEVLHKIAELGDFFAVVWFSARDIDLLPDRPRVVRPDVVSRDDIAFDFASLMKPKDPRPRSAQALELLADSLSGKSADGPFVFVFDNFETMREQSALFAFLSNTVRLPNKVLITTRTRDFKADYPIEVRGMEREEYAAMVDEVAVRLGITSLLNTKYLDELYDDSDGHPYITKVMLGEVAHAGKRLKLGQVIASKDGTLDALFERSFASLSLAAQRVFLTLCSWRSIVPKLGLEAVVLRQGNDPVDVETALQELVQTSLVEELVDEEGGSDFLSVPLAAALFGKRKLVTSALKTAIDADLELVKGFGVMTSVEVAQGLGPRVDKLARSVARNGRSGPLVEQGLSVIEYIASEYPRAWLTLAELQQELGRSSDAAESLKRYLGGAPGDKSAWERLIALHRNVDDPLEEVHARLQLAELAHPTYDDLSTTASRLNLLLSKREVGRDADERRLMIKPLRALMEARRSEADATDFSRLAWLCLHLQDAEAARTWAEAGLALEADNSHCLALKKRLNTATPIQ